MVIWEILKDRFYELDTNRLAILESAVLKETINNKEFMKTLETTLNKVAGGGYKS
jgi:hypothetical protein